MRPSTAPMRRRAASTPGTPGTPSSPFAAGHGFAASETASQESTASSEASRRTSTAKRSPFSGPPKQVTEVVDDIKRAQGRASTLTQSAAASIIEQLKAQVTNLSEEAEEFKSAEQIAQAEAKEAEESNAEKQKALRSKLLKAQKTAKAISEERDAETCNSRIAFAEVDAFRTAQTEAEESLHQLYEGKIQSLQTELSQATAYGDDCAEKAKVHQARCCLVLEERLEEAGLVDRLRSELAARPSSEAEQLAEERSRAESQECALEVATRELQLLRCQLKEAEAHETNAVEYRSEAFALREANELANANRKSMVESEQSAQQAWLQEVSVFRHEVDSAREAASERDSLVASLRCSLTEVEVRCKTEANELEIQRGSLAAAELVVQQSGSELAATRAELNEALAEQQRSVQQLLSRSVSLDGVLEEIRNLSKSLTAAESKCCMQSKEVHMLSDELEEFRSFQQTAEGNAHSSSAADSEICEQLSAERAACQLWQEEVAALRNKHAEASEAASRQSDACELSSQELAEDTKQRVSALTIEAEDEESDASDDAATPDLDMSQLIGRGKSGWWCSEVTGRLLIGAEVATIGLGFKNMPPAPLIVNRVNAGSWAADQGLEAGDEIVSIDFRRAREFTKTEFVQVMQKRPLCLRFKRTVADGDMVSVLKFTEAEEEKLQTASATELGRLRPRHSEGQPRTESGLRVIDEDRELESSKGDFTEAGESESDFSDDDVADLDPDCPRDHHSALDE
eukprot:TRINITY_DN104471_c0_g1_i1.p1 TRINITY_DN104471_c0_g1~~TRINITY_DN104471_c0_g1_i1.p1  ORF type:complete len:745 (-),score=184.83 TRINITY_DN104471_c0_g1_i1:435-2669(-)